MQNPDVIASKLAKLWPLVYVYVKFNVFSGGRAKPQSVKRDGWGSNSFEAVAN